MKSVVGAVSILVVLLILLFCELTVVFDSVKERVAQQVANRKAHETVVFSCGYLYGKRAIWDAANFPPEQRPSISADCIEARDIAEKNGFSSAKD